jgi:hypothetical protein
MNDNEGDLFDMEASDEEEVECKVENDEELFEKKIGDVIPIERMKTSIFFKIRLSLPASISGEEITLDICL